MSRKNSFFIVVIVAILLVGLTNCKNESKHNGFMLQRFEVIEPQLKSILKGIQDSIYIKDILNPEKKVIIMLLRVHDSLPEFCFTSTEEGKVPEYYTYSMGRRIIGYIDIGGVPLIVLSNEPKKYDIESNFYKFLIPTSDKKYFDYIYFPDDQYIVAENGIPPPPPLFNPHYYCFAYKDGKMVYMNYYNTAVTDTVLDVSN